MTKTKRQLRAEAVERLKNLESSGMSYMPSDVLEKVTPFPNANIAMLIDLLTDDEPPEGDVLGELHFYADENRYDYDPLKDAFEVDERLSELCGHVADMVERDFVRRGEYEDLANANGRQARKIHDVCELNETLRAERDEWKAKAEHDRVRRSKNGARRGMTNLEWLQEHKPDFVADWVSMAKYCSHCAFDDDCSGFLGADDPKCARGNREWLMAEHVDGGTETAEYVEVDDDDR